MGRLKSLRPALASLPSRVALPPKVAEQFYTSPEWRGLVQRIKRARGNWCERCGSSDRVIADHIVERKDGGADFDPSNIQLLCHRHHQTKTAEARRRRARGQA